MRQIYITPHIDVLCVDSTIHLLEESGKSGVNNEGNVDTTGSTNEGDASGAHSKLFEFEVEDSSWDDHCWE